MLSVFDELALPNFAVTENGKSPATVGCPVIFPDESSTSPAGSPLPPDHVAPAGYDASAAEYELPSTLCWSVVVVMFMVSA